ncbi:unnamed protein product, partial [Adineta steineri]
NKEEVFSIALKRNLPEFVYEFIKLGIDPSKIFFENNAFFVSKNRYKRFFKCLYSNKAVNSDDTQLSAFIESDNAIGKHIGITDDLNDVLTTLVGDYMHKLYFDSNADEIKYRVSWGLIDQNVEYNQTNPTNSDHHDKSSKERVFDTIMRDLFIWAILMNHTEMAQVFLSHMKY